MNFDASRFRIGVVELFAVLLPGALLAYVVHPLVLPWIGVEGGLSWDTHTVAVFLVVSYVVGNIVFLLGSKLDGTADQVRELKSGGSKGDAKPGSILSFLYSVLFVKDPSFKAMEAATHLKVSRLGKWGDRGVINTFQWAKAVLAAHQPGMLSAVQRHEADSKFHRSFLIVLAILFVLMSIALCMALAGKDAHLLLAPGAAAGGSVRHRVWFLLLLAALGWLAAMCYLDQRTKAIDLACRYIIALPGKEAPPEPVRAPTHAGGVVCRSRPEPGGGTVQVLLVRAKDDPGKWVLPKGHIEAGEAAQYTAVREVYEESGVHALLCDTGPPEEVTFEAKGERVHVVLYPMRCVGEADGGGEARTKEWVPAREALDRLRASQAAQSADAVEALLDRLRRNTGAPSAP